jgi:pimeloyl-ACP methyl ester carboxylesterase
VGEVTANVSVDGGPTTFVLIPGAGADPRVYAATIAAARLQPARLILLAPMIPAPGESAGDWWRGTDHEAAIAPLIERHGTPSEWGEEAMAEVFYHDVDDATLAANAQYEGAPAPGLFAEPLPLAAWPDVPTTVLAGRDDRLFPLSFQQRVASERLGSGEVAEIDGGHLPMLARPRELAERLVELN